MYVEEVRSELLARDFGQRSQSTDSAQSALSVEGLEWLCSRRGRHYGFELSIGRSGTEAIGESGGIAGSCVLGSIGQRPSNVHSDVVSTRLRNIYRETDRTCRSLSAVVSLRLADAYQSDAYHQTERHPLPQNPSPLQICQHRLDSFADSCILRRSLS